MDSKQSEVTLNSPPSDGISAVKFQPGSSQYLLVSSWDKSVRLYDVNANTMRAGYNHSAPVLDCCFHDSVHTYSGGLDQTLKMYDFNVNKETIVGSHEGPIRCVEYCADANVIITGSWDQTIKLWDPRTPCAAGSFSQPDKVYTMSVLGDKLVVGTAARWVLVWDLRNMGTMQQRRESNLKYQTRCIRAFPNQLGWVLSSIEGRVAVEYLDPSPEVQKKRYAFKCHRVKEDKLEKIYPVSSVAFHSQFNTFATGGGDGNVYVWDPFNKKRLCQYHRYPTSISSLAFSHDGSSLAIASSYMYELGEMMSPPPPDQIFIKQISSSDVRPK